MKKILLSLPYGMSARNFLRSAFYPTLKEKAELVVVTPMAEDPQFLEEFNDPRVKFVAIPRKSGKFVNAMTRLFYVLSTYKFVEDHPISTLVMLKNQLKTTQPKVYWLYSALFQLFGHWDFILKGIEQIYFNLIRNPRLTQLFRDSKFDLVFLTHGYVQEEVELAVEASHQKVKTALMVHSWDNLTSKSGLRQLTSPYVGRTLPVHLINWFVVWNSILEEELVSLYDVPRGTIYKAGVPQFDEYVDKSRRLPRDEFFRSLGGDPKKKLLYYMATSPYIIHDQTVVIESLINALRQNKFDFPCQLLIRFHPRTEMSSWIDRFKGPDVFFQNPSAAFGANVSQKGWTPEPEHNDLADAIYHCDVVINGFSTTSIDGAIFDKPIVCYGYDRDKTHQPMIPQYYATSHYVNLVKTQGVRLAYDETTLIKTINAYLNDPTLDAAGREQIRKDQAYRLDGQSGRRVADFLLSLIS